MPQFGLLLMLVPMPLQMLSGAAAGKHARDHPEHHACRAEHPLRQSRAGRAVRWRRTRRRLAAARRPAGDRRDSVFLLSSAVQNLLAIASDGCHARAADPARAMDTVGGDTEDRRTSDVRHRQTFTGTVRQPQPVQTWRKRVHPPPQPLSQLLPQPLFQLLPQPPFQPQLGAQAALAFHAAALARPKPTPAAATAGPRQPQRPRRQATLAPPPRQPAPRHPAPRHPPPATPTR